MPVVNTTNTFTNNEQITSTKLNDIMDNSSFVSGAVVTSGGLEITAGGQMQIASDGVTTAKILDSNVTTAKIADGNVTPAKLSTGGPSWTGATGALSVVQPSIEIGNGITSSSSSFVDFHSVFPITDYETRIIRNTGADGTFVITNTGTGSIIFSASGGVTFGSANMPTPTGNAPLFGVRAWVNFNGTSGSVAIRQDGNVDSVSRTGTGLYTINLTTPMHDTNYAIVGFARDAGTSPGNYFVSAVSNGTKTTSSFQIRVHSTGGLVDSPEIDIMVIR
jgi:hypothetical protein